MSIYGTIEHATGIPWVLQAAVLAAALLIGAGLLVRRQIAAAGGGVVPDQGFTLRNAFEVLAEALGSIARDNMGPEYRRWLPLVCTIFVFVLVSNLLGLIPGLGGATSDINTTAAWALISVAVAEWVGIRTHGWGYIKHFLGPSAEVKLFGKTRHLYYLAWMFIPLEIFSHLVRVLSLSIRLLANMFADHTLVAVWLSLVPAVIPAIFMGLGLMVAVLQAFVFSLLTMVYIGLALDEAH